MIMAFFIFMPLFGEKNKAEQKIRFSSVSSYFKERLEQLSLHSDRLSAAQKEVVEGASAYYQEMKNHHSHSKTQKRIASIPVSVYKQLNKILEDLERKADLRPPAEPKKKYVESNSRGKVFRKFLSLPRDTLDAHSYWKKVLEITGIGVVLLLIYKTIIHPPEPQIIVVNGEPNQSLEKPPASTPLDTNLGE